MLAPEFTQALSAFKSRYRKDAVMCSAIFGACIAGFWENMTSYVITLNTIVWGLITIESYRRIRKLRAVESELRVQSDEEVGMEQN